jgi:transcriptional regulator with XRE-family HTH domain
MKRTGTNQRKLAGMLGISDAWVSLVMRGLRHWSLDQAARLSLITGIPVEKLLTGGDASRLLKLLGKRDKAAAETANGTV